MSARRRLLTWLPVDLVLVGVFAVLGRLSHYDSLSVGGWWTTAWPFLTGTLLAWTALLFSRRAPDTIGSGIVVWLVTLIGGMLLRQVSDQGTATPFVIVATLVVGAVIVLPRVALRMARTAVPARR